MEVIVTFQFAGIQLRDYHTVCPNATTGYGVVGTV